MPHHQDKNMVWNQLIQRIRMYDNQKETAGTLKKT